MKFRFSSVPYIVWSVIFVVVPLILVAVFGLSTSDGQFTFANVAKVSDYTAVFVRSIWLSLVATAICLVIAYPLGFIMSRYNANNQRTLVMLVMLPMWTNFLLRTYANPTRWKLPGTSAPTRGIPLPVWCCPFRCPASPPASPWYLCRLFPPLSFPVCWAAAPI